jgi:hypothetical protein
MVKVKLDFVTNSSSSCFILFIPNEFQIKEKDIIDLIRDEGRYWGPKLPDHVYVEELPKAIDHLKAGKNIWTGGRWGGRICSALYTILEENGFIISQFEIGGEDHILAPINYESIIKILMNQTNLGKLVKNFSEGSHITSKTS